MNFSKIHDDNLKFVDFFSKMEFPIFLMNFPNCSMDFQKISMRPCYRVDLGHRGKSLTDNKPYTSLILSGLRKM